MPTSPGRVCDLGGPRGARGLSDACYTSKRGRCGDARDVCRGHRLECPIFERNCNEGKKLVLFALKGLTWHFIYRQNTTKSEPMPPREEVAEAEGMKPGSIWVDEPMAAAGGKAPRHPWTSKGSGRRETSTGGSLQRCTNKIRAAKNRTANNTHGLALN